MSLAANARRVLDELTATVERVDTAEAESLVSALSAARSVHVIGVGREGLSARAFTMRLMHAGLDAHWVWDDTTPAIGPGDLLLAVSGSGAIGHIDYVARRAQEQGARLAVVTASANGPTVEAADLVLRVPGSAYRAGDDVVASIQPMGSLFEQALLVVFDLLLLDLVALRGLGLDELSPRHRNVE